MTLRCPTCHAKHPVEAFSEDRAAQELLRHSSLGTFSPTLLAYLSLFRTEKRDMPYSRTLKLAGEVMELGEPLRLEAALATTVESLRAKRDAGDKRPLKDHAYLKRVLEGVPSAGLRDLVPGAGEMVATPAVPVSKTARGIGKLQERKR